MVRKKLLFPSEEMVSYHLNKLYTGHEKDDETGLIYFGDRYLDPQSSMWLSADPAMGEYVPAPGKGADGLPGMGGVYNSINMHVFAYAGNNPIRYIDPDGNAIIISNLYLQDLFRNHVQNSQLYASYKNLRPDFFDDSNYAQLVFISFKHLNDEMGGLTTYKLDMINQINVDINNLAYNLLYGDYPNITNAYYIFLMVHEITHVRDIKATNTFNRITDGERLIYERNAYKAMFEFYTEKWNSDKKSADSWKAGASFAFEVFGMEGSFKKFNPRKGWDEQSKRFSRAFERDLDNIIKKSNM
jgi:RHS repeat-associated protein